MRSYLSYQDKFKQYVITLERRSNSFVHCFSFRFVDQIKQRITIVSAISRYALVTNSIDKDLHR
jgi:hypothetical protein